MTIRYDQQTHDRAIRLWLEYVQDGVCSTPIGKYRNGGSSRART